MPFARSFSPGIRQSNVNSRSLFSGLVFFQHSLLISSSLKFSSDKVALCCQEEFRKPFPSTRPTRKSSLSRFRVMYDDFMYNPLIYEANGTINCTTRSISFEKYFISFLGPHFRVLQLLNIIHICDFCRGCTWTNVIAKNILFSECPENCFCRIELVRNNIF